MSVSIGTIDQGGRVSVCLNIDGIISPLFGVNTLAEGNAFAHGFSVGMQVMIAQQKRTLTDDDIRLMVENSVLDAGLHMTVENGNDAQS